MTDSGTDAVQQAFRAALHSADDAATTTLQRAYDTDPDWTISAALSEVTNDSDISNEGGIEDWERVSTTLRQLMFDRCVEPTPPTCRGLLDAIAACDTAHDEHRLARLVALTGCAACVVGRGRGDSAAAAPFVDVASAFAAGDKGKSLWLRCAGCKALTDFFIGRTAFVDINDPDDPVFDRALRAVASATAAAATTSVAGSDQIAHAAARWVGDMSHEFVLGDDAVQQHVIDTLFPHVVAAARMHLSVVQELYEALQTDDAELQSPQDVGEAFLAIAADGAVEWELRSMALLLVPFGLFNDQLDEWTEAIAAALTVTQEAARSAVELSRDQRAAAVWVARFIEDASPTAVVRSATQPGMQDSAGVVVMAALRRAAVDPDWHTRAAACALMSACSFDCTADMAAFLADDCETVRVLALTPGAAWHKHDPEVVRVLALTPHAAWHQHADANTVLAALRVASKVVKCSDEGSLMGARAVASLLRHASLATDDESQRCQLQRSCRKLLSLVLDRVGATSIELRTACIDALGALAGCGLLDAADAMAVYTQLLAAATGRSGDDATVAVPDAQCRRALVAATEALSGVAPNDRPRAAEAVVALLVAWTAAGVSFDDTDRVLAFLTAWRYVIDAAPAAAAAPHIGSVVGLTMQLLDEVKPDGIRKHIPGRSNPPRENALLLAAIPLVTSLWRCPSPEVRAVLQPWTADAALLGTKIAGEARQHPNVCCELLWARLAVALEAVTGGLAAAACDAGRASNMLAALHKLHLNNMTQLATDSMECFLRSFVTVLQRQSNEHPTVTLSRVLVASLDITRPAGVRRGLADEVPAACEHRQAVTCVAFALCSPLFLEYIPSESFPGTDSPTAPPANSEGPGHTIAAALARYTDLFEFPWLEPTDRTVLPVGAVVPALLPHVPVVPTGSSDDPQHEVDAAKCYKFAAFHEAVPYFAAPAVRAAVAVLTNPASFASCRLPALATAVRLVFGWKVDSRPNTPGVESAASVLTACLPHLPPPVDDDHDSSYRPGAAVVSALIDALRVDVPAMANYCAMARVPADVKEQLVRRLRKAEGLTPEQRSLLNDLAKRDRDE